MDIESDHKNRIRQTAHDLFMQYGLKSVSMDDIAAKMGISKKTIYQFFADKETLVAEVITAIIEENKRQCDLDKSRANDAVQEIFFAMEQMSSLFHHMNPSILFDLYKYYPKAFQIFQSHKNNYLFEIIKSNIQRGIAEELYRDDINQDIIARFRLESIVLPFHPEFHQKVKYTLAEIAEELSKHFLFGIVSQKGHKLILKYFKSTLIK